MSLRITRRGDDSILAKIVKLAPAEVIGVYLLGKGVIPESFFGTWTFICIGLALLSRWVATDKNVLAVLVSVISFALWVLAIGDPILTLALEKWMVSIFILVFTFVLPLTGWIPED